MLREYLHLPLPVRILCFGSLINRAGSFVMVFLAIYASEQLGFGVPFATSCIGVLGLGAMVGSLLGGYLSDRVGRKFVMLFALCGGAAVLLWMSVLTNRWAFMASVGCFAMIADLYRPAASAMIADFVSVDRRAHAFALMYISVNLGFAIAPPIGGLLASVSFEWLFWIDAVTMIGYGILIFFAIEDASDKKRPDSSDHKRVESNAGEPFGSITRGPEISVFESARHIIADKTFMWFCLSSLMMAIVFVQAMSTLPIFIRQSGYSNLQFGLLMSVNGVLIVLLQLPLTHWLAKFNAMTVVAVGGILIAIGFGLTAAGGGLWWLSLTIVVWTLGEILQAPFKQSIVTEMAPRELRGRYLGVFGMCFSLALTIGSPIGGEVLHRYGPTKLWLGVFVIAAIAVALYAAIHPAVTRRIAVVSDIGTTPVKE